MKSWQAILAAGVLVAAAVWFREPQNAQAQFPYIEDARSVMHNTAIARCVLDNMGRVGELMAAHYVAGACQLLFSQSAK